MVAANATPCDAMTHLTDKELSDEFLHTSNAKKQLSAVPLESNCEVVVLNLSLIHI